jgi:hypothetical protein
MASRDPYYDYNSQAQQYNDPYSNQYQQPQYPPQQPYPPYPPQQPYPQQPYPQYPPPQKKSNVVLIVVIILIVVFVILPVIFAGILYVWVSDFETGGDGGSVKISSLKTEKQYAFVITISSVSGGTLNLDEAEFQITDDDGLLKYRLNINDANPASIRSGESIIYPMTAGFIAVTDGSGGSLDGYDSLSDYINCTIAYIDQNDDERVSADDSIWIYMDNNNDGIEDVKNKYSFKIINDYDEVVHSKQL